jgi:hypothetical protein
VEKLEERKSFVLEGEVVTLATLNAALEPGETQNLIVDEPCRPHDLDFYVQLVHTYLRVARLGGDPSCPHWATG